MNVSAYRLASWRFTHELAGLNVVVVKNTMSPATAGNAVTFSSVLLVLLRLRLNCCTELAPWSRMPTNRYTSDASVEGSRSLPLPKKRYWFADPTLIDASELKIG